MEVGARCLLRSLPTLAWAAAALAIAAAAGAQPPTAGHYPYFPADAPWTQHVSQAPVDSESPTVISWLAGHGGWGGGQMQIDFSIEALETAAGTPFRAFTPNRPDEFFDPLQVTDFEMIAAGDRYTWNGDCARESPLFNDGFEIAIADKWSGQAP